MKYSIILAGALAAVSLNSGIAKAINCQSNIEIYKEFPNGSTDIPDVVDNSSAEYRHAVSDPYLLPSSDRTTVIKEFKLLTKDSFDRAGGSLVGIETKNLGGGYFKQTAEIKLDYLPKSVKFTSSGSYGYFGKSARIEFELPSENLNYKKKLAVYTYCDSTIAP